MTKPKLSIITTVYNCSKYVRESIDSVLGQTFGDYEFIIVNDGSTDDTADFVRSYQDDRIVLLTTSTIARYLGGATKLSQGPGRAWSRSTMETTLASPTVSSDRWMRFGTMAASSLRWRSCRKDRS